MDNLNISSNHILLKSVAEELRLPLVQISRLSESKNDDKQTIIGNLKIIESSADLALQLLESYILGLDYNDGQKQIELSPITMGAVFNDVAHQVHKIANQNNCDIELEIKNTHPIMGNYEAIKLAFINIANSILVSTDTNEIKERRSMTLSVFSKGPKNFAGIYTNNLNITRSSWERSLLMFEKSRQKMPNFSANNCSGFYVAHNILETMSSTLIPSKHNGMRGLAADFKLSHQMQLV